MPPFVNDIFSDKTASCLLERKLERILIGLRDFILHGKIRTAGMGSDTAHGKVDADIHEVIFFQLEGVQRFTKLFCCERIDRAGERL